MIVLQKKQNLKNIYVIMTWREFSLLTSSIESSALNPSTEYNLGFHENGFCLDAKISMKVCIWQQGSNCITKLWKNYSYFQSTQRLLVNVYAKVPEKISEGVIENLAIHYLFWELNPKNVRRCLSFHKQANRYLVLWYLSTTHNSNNN